MAGHQLAGMCCNEKLVNMGVASGKGISLNPARPLNEDEVLATLILAWRREDVAQLNPLYYASNEEYLEGIPKQPDQCSEGTFLQKMKF